MLFRSGQAAPLTLKDQLAPLSDARVWRFSLYYFFVFGGFVALALWLPRYFIGVYQLDITTAGILGAAYSIPGSLFRVYGGVLSDRVGARRVMYWSLGAAVLCTFILSYPSTDYVVHGIHGDLRFNFSVGLIPFTVLVFVLGFFMAIGKAAVYRHIPVYYPEHVGPVGGVVGMIGGLGGFILPIAFGMMNDVTGLWTSCFMLLFLIWLGPESATAHADLPTWALLAVSGIVTAIPLIWFIAAARRLPLVAVGLLQFISPSLNFLLAVGLFGEAFTPTHMAAFGFIWVALALHTFESARKKPA